MAAQSISRDGETVLKVKLSKSGKAKLRQLKKDDAILTEVAGVTSNFKIRETILGEDLEIGPYSPGEAQAIVKVINQQR